MANPTKIQNNILRALKIGRDAAERELERNEMLKEIGFGQFALSKDVATVEALKAADVAFAKQMSEAITRG
jgi:hypothetical protein